MGDALREHFTGLDGRDDPVLDGRGDPVFDGWDDPARDDPMLWEGNRAISCWLLVWWFLWFLPCIRTNISSSLGIHPTSQLR